MKPPGAITAEKLRGGFYSPPDLVMICLDRVAGALGDRRALTVLEPSAGDGAFIRGLDAHPLGERITSVTAVEVVPVEAARCERAGASAKFTLDVQVDSFLAMATKPIYDIAVGNPPFVRYQFVSPDQRGDAEEMAAEAGFALNGVSNLWIPILIKALRCLRDGGAFAFIVPAESLTGISAAEVRRWLLANVGSLRLDLFATGSFPDVMQEVVILSGVMRVSAPGLTVADHCGSLRTWRHLGLTARPTWTPYLLTPAQLDAVDEASSLPGCVRLGEVARFSVSTVTGANSFFCVDRATVEAYGLEPWTRSLLPRIRHAPGLRFGPDDYERIRATAIRASLLDFEPSGPDPKMLPGPTAYLQIGIDAELHLRYKCRIREPWFRVPVVRPGDLLLSKRSHRYPRVVVNEARVVTTDTIYQARLTPAYAGQARAVAASFHNSLTLLSAEVEGRSFGGGVLELVPTEVARLRLVPCAQLADDFGALDAIGRSHDPDALVAETDRRLAKAVPGLGDALLATLAGARADLQRRRLARNPSA